MKDDFIVKEEKEEGIIMDFENKNEKVEEVKLNKE